VILGLFLVLAGLGMIVRPIEAFFIPLGPYKYVGLLPSGDGEAISKTRSRFYGVVAVVIGSGICWFASYRPRD